MSAPQRKIGHSEPWHLRLALVDALVTTRTYVHDLLGVQHHGSQCLIPSLRHSTLVEKQESSVAEADAGSLDFALRQQQTFVFCILNVRLGIKESAHFFFPGFFCRWRLASEIPPSDLVRHLSRFPTHNSTDGACNAHSRCTGSNVNNSILALPRIWPHVISHAHPLGELFDCSSADLPPDWRRCIALRIKEEGTCSIEEIDRAAESAAASLTCNVSPAMCNLNMGHEFRWPAKPLFTELAIIWCSRQGLPMKWTKIFRHVAIFARAVGILFRAPVPEVDLIITTVMASMRHRT